MLTCTDKEEILSLDLVHHFIHFSKAHNTCNNVASDHKRRDNICESLVDHEISCVCKDSAVKSCDVAYKIVESVSGYSSCCLKIKTCQVLHNICMIRNFEIRNYRLTELLNLNIFLIVLSDRNRIINDIRNDEHDVTDLVLYLWLCCFKLCKSLCVLCNLCLNCLCLFLLSLCHKCTDFLGNLILVGTDFISFCLTFSSLLIEFYYFVN